MFRFYLLLIFLLLFMEPMYAIPKDNQKIELDLNNVSIPDALRILAKLNHFNLIISPAVHGSTTLHFHDISPLDALDAVLKLHALKRWSVQDVWFVGLESDWMHSTQEELKLHNMMEELTPLETKIWKIIYAKSENIAQLIQSNPNSFLSKRGQVRADVRTNTLFVRDTKDRIQAIHQLIQSLDISIPQVLIEAHLASVDHDAERDLGIQFTVSSTHDGLTIAKLANNSWLNLKLSALERMGKGELISNPSLFTANQQTASIEAGEEIPYQETSRNGATAVTFKKAVLSLKVTPQILPDQKMILDIQLHQDKPNKRIVLGVPAISTRQISTNVMIKSGQTLVLGGIYETNKEEEQQYVPFLSKIPIIGLIFNQKSSSNNKRELLIFITPKIIR